MVQIETVLPTARSHCDIFRKEMLPASTMTQREEPTRWSEKNFFWKFKKV